MSPILAALAVLLAFAGARELTASEAGARISRRLRRGLPIASSTLGARGLSESLGVSARLERAGLERRFTVRGFMLFKGAGAVAGVVAALLADPVAPGRLRPLLFIVLLIAGFLAPDALAERHGRRRRSSVVAALPDALDLLAVGSSGGRSPAAVLAEVAASGPEPLASELAISLAEVECGQPLEQAMGRMRRRVPGPELGALSSALERSRRHGSPLAEQLHTQAAALRARARRRVGERAARAAPKIQLVIALVLVPSVLLTIVAAFVANSDTLFAGLR